MKASHSLDLLDCVLIFNTLEDVVSLAIYRAADDVRRQAFVAIAQSW